MNRCKVLSNLKTLPLCGSLLIGGGVWIGSAVAQETVPGEAVSGVDFGCSVEADVSRVTCRAKGNLSFDGVQHFTLDDPDRLVIDIPKFKVKAPENYSLADAPVIQRIRSGQRGDSARVVLDLKHEVSVSLFVSPDKRTFSLDLSSVQVPPPSPPTVAAVSPSSLDEGDDSGAEEESSDVAQDGQKLSVVPPQQPVVSVSIPKRAIMRDDILKFSVDSTFISIEPGDRPLRDVQVTNKTSQEIFLRTDVQRVYDSGMPQERYENTNAFVATPRRFALPPLSTRAVRLLLTTDPPSEGEEMYRLILSPEPMPETDVEVEGTMNEQPAKFKVVAALGVTVALPSPEAKGVVRIESQVNQVALINSGTRAVLVENCLSCPLDKESCVSSGKKILYPERPWALPVRGSGVINCEFSLGKQKQKLSSLYGAKEPQ